ncbi:MAG: tetratricopeptide repeat protein [Clostridium fessum]
MSLAFTALASAARDAGDSELAAQYCNQAIERGVSGSEIYNQLAISEMEAGDYESAISHYEEALSLADSETALVIRQNIAVLYEKEGDFAKALEQFKECYKSLVWTHRRCRRKSVFWKAGKYWR